MARPKQNQRKTPATKKETVQKKTKKKSEPIVVEVKRIAAEEPTAGTEEKEGERIPTNSSPSQEKVKVSIEHCKSWSI
jgi:hypothetical protein